jgi:hypothetical protein
LGQQRGAADPEGAIVTGRSGLIDISVVLVHQTDRAVLIDHGGDENVWLPKSAIEIERDASGKTWTVTLPERLAQEKGLI